MKLWMSRRYMRNLVWSKRESRMQEVRSSILLISTIKNTITTRFMSRVVIFVYGKNHKGRPKGGPFTKKLRGRVTF